MSIKILPVKEPIVNCYTSYGAIFSILPESAMPWVMNNFIQLNFVYSWNMPTFGLHRQIMSNCPAIEYFGERKIEKGEANRKLKDVIIDGINRNEYLFIYADRYYIKVSEEFQKYHIDHEVFIYGYDLEKDLVYVGDNFKNGKFIFATCTFSEIEEAYANISGTYDFLYIIRYLKVHENEFCDLNVQQILSNLDAYLNSNAIYDMVGEFSKMEYGISVVDKVLNEIKQVEGKRLDIRFFHIYYEHKLLMEMRVKYLIENGYIDVKEIEPEEFSTLKNDAKLLRNLVLKYNINRRCNLLSQIYDKLNKIKQRDIMSLLYLKWLLKQIVIKIT